MTETLWRQILERFRMTRGLTRPRLPLVLRRAAGPHAAGHRSDQRWFHTMRNQYAVHVHLSWPQWLTGVSEAQARGVVAALSGPGLVARTPLTSQRHWSKSDIGVPAPPDESRFSPGSSRFVTARASHAAPAAAIPGTTPRIAFVGTPVHRVQSRDTEPRSSAVVPDSTLFSSIQRRMAAWTTAIHEDVKVSRTLVTRATRGIRHTELLQVTRRLAATPAPNALQAASTTFPPSWMTAPTYTHAAPRMVKAQPDSAASMSNPQPLRTIERTATTHRPEPVTPHVNIERLSEEVYRQIQKRIRIERERRGL